MDSRAYHGRSCQAGSQPHSNVRLGHASIRAQAHVKRRSTPGRPASILAEYFTTHSLPLAQHRRRGHSIQTQPSWVSHAGPDLWLPPSSRNPREEEDAARSTETDDATAAAKLEAFCAALQPEIDDDGLAQFVEAVPEVMSMPPALVRQRLDELASMSGLELAAVASLVSFAPVVWERPPQALGNQVTSLSKELSLEPKEVANLLAVVPPILNVSQPTIIKDRLETLGDRLRVRGGPGAAARQVMRQPVLWSVPAQHIQSNIPTIASSLAISDEEAISLVARVPVVVSLEPQLLQLQLKPQLLQLPISILRMLARLACLSCRVSCGPWYGLGLSCSSEAAQYVLEQG
ncbi:hypothetical protein DUNSADRAFT_6902 [Dunaliella salina]|uniref:Encoded protein n=1 Tax=Dunaliella salina TaxID=3046 RepID=A0ABQ7GMI9_DUNSA|nr:hypothetical protein DUNSADRAFT_6902 [Dunaliella salina]|eukprot:KAF5835762.1 hypothetical protein DUNSADRAFT_6902 [Dunaliella salina]